MKNVHEIFHISRKQFMIYLQDGEEPSTGYKNILERCIYREGLEEVEEHFKVNINGTRTAWVCKTCQRYMQGDKMPPICHKNGLEIVTEPKLQRLTKFDNVLIARKIPFMFISQLPKSRMEALKGKSTLVPIQEEDIRNTVQAGQQLPRTPDYAGLVTYELR